MDADKQNGVIKITKVPKLLPRQDSSHKGDFGRVLAVGGSADMAGAVGLCSRAALRGGAGLVKMALPQAARAMAAVMCPSATSVALACDSNGYFDCKAVSQLGKLTSEADVVAVGPGMGVSTACEMMLVNILGANKPVVIDADGLNNLSKIEDWAALRKCPCVLTPHPGEMARLCGVPTAQLQKKRRDMAIQSVNKWQGRLGTAQPEMTLVLKGHETIVTDGKRIYTNTTGNPGMATGGSGDVLTGLTAALLAQGMDVFDAAICAVWLHGKAGDLAAEKYGQVSLVSEDIIEFLPPAFLNLGVQDNS